MSDSQRRYHAVKAKMSQLLPEQWAACPSRLVNLSLLVSSMVKAKDLTQHALAAEMPLMAQDTSLAQRQRRWLMNEAVTAEAYYEPIIVPVLHSLSQATIPLILDTTAAGANGHLLSVAVGYHHRALPVAWQAGEGKRGQQRKGYPRRQTERPLRHAHQPPLEQEQGRQAEKSEKANHVRDRRQKHR